MVLKLFGLYHLIQVAFHFMDLNYTMYFVFMPNSWVTYVGQLINLIFACILLFKPDMVIRWLKLEVGFDNTSVTNQIIDGIGITKAALIIISIQLMVANVGVFITQVVLSFKESVSQNALDTLLGVEDHNPVNYQQLIYSAFSLSIGILLFTNYVRLANWIMKLNTSDGNRN